MLYQSSALGARGQVFDGGLGGCLTGKHPGLRDRIDQVTIKRTRDRTPFKTSAPITQPSDLPETKAIEDLLMALIKDGRNFAANLDAYATEAGDKLWLWGTKMARSICGLELVPTFSLVLG